MKNEYLAAKMFITFKTWYLECRRPGLQELWVPLLLVTWEDSLEKATGQTHLNEYSGMAFITIKDTQRFRT